MRTGFVTETHTLVYCGGCGQPWNPDNDGTPACLSGLDDTEMTRRIEALGWQVDGDRVVCDACSVIAVCELFDHRFDQDRTCRDCGLMITEVIDWEPVEGIDF